MSRMFRALERAESEASHGATIDSRPSRFLDAVPDLDLPEFRDDYERLKVMLALAGSRTDQRAIMFVSALPGEGVSTVALGFACTAVEAASRGVLIIDADLARPQLSARLGVTGTAGLAELIGKRATAIQTVQKTAIQGLFFLGPGRGAVDLTQPRARDTIEELLAGFRATFDYIVVDGGAVQGPSDSLLLASRMDAVVLVLRAERTGIDTAQAAIAQLRRAGANIVGTILNRRREYLPGFLARRL
jgi:Mrp family chromosome partitioning ATPase